MAEMVIKPPATPKQGQSGSLSVESRARTYRPDIDGLRSLAILSVVLFHAGVRQISGGFTGVDIFFAISGYLIGGHIYAELGSGVFRFSNFYRNRAKRILPALYVVLLSVLAIGLVLLSPHELRDLAKYIFFTTASASNIELWKTTGYFAANADLNPLLMTWSLGVEEQFYLVIPVLMVLIARFRRQHILPAILLVSVASFIIAAFQVNRYPDSAFYLLTSRAWELGVGVGLAIFEAEKRTHFASAKTLVHELLSWVGLVLIVAPFFALNSSIAFPGPAAIPSVLGAALLLFSSGGWVNRKLLSAPPLVFVGRVSYSFYLVHWPILAFLRVLLGRTLPESWGLGAIVVAFGLALLSYYFVEKPFRLSKLQAGSLLWRYAAVSVALLALSATIYKVKGLPGRYPLAAAIDQKADTAPGPSNDVCLVKSGASSPNLAAVCAGVGTTTPHIALWGDSHASAIAAALRTVSTSQGYFLEEYAKTSCPPLYGVGRSYRTAPAELTECIRFNDAVLHRLLDDPEVQVVVLDAFWDGAFNPIYPDQGRLARLGHNTKVAISQAETVALLKSSLTETLQALLDARKQVIVLGDTPVFEIDPPWRMRTRAIPLRWTLSNAMNGGSEGVDRGLDAASDDNPQQTEARHVLEETTLSFPRARFWDMREKLCTSNGLCAYREGNTLLFSDENHLTREGALRVLEGLKIVQP